MKKLRFFGLLAVVLLVFALVISCGNAGGGLTTLPDDPDEGDEQQYPIYPGGTGAKGYPIPAKSISIDIPAIAIELGD